MPDRGFRCGRFRWTRFDDRGIGMFKFLRLIFALIDRISPNAAGRLAVSVFYSPRRFPEAKWETIGLQEGRPDAYQFKNERLGATIWGAEGRPVVLLVHGWQGRRGQLCKFALSLASKGFKVVAIDGPAHGSSKLRRTTLVEFAKAVAAACRAFGPVDSIIGHSFGAAAAAIAARSIISTQRLVLISCPYSLRHVVTGFAEYVGLPRRSHEAMYPVMENLHGCCEDELSFERIGPDLNLPTLLIHDEDDRYIPFADGKRVHRLIHGSGFQGTKGLGHMRILQSSEVIDRAVSFVTAAPSQSLNQAESCLRHRN